MEICWVVKYHPLGVSYYCYHTSHKECTLVIYVYYSYKVTMRIPARTRIVGDWRWLTHNLSTIICSWSNI